MGVTGQYCYYCGYKMQLMVINEKKKRKLEVHNTKKKLSKREEKKYNKKSNL